MPGKKALCVGINKFRNYPSENLQGCVNDANEMSAVLIDLLGFTSKDITILTDAKATKANIMKQLKAMVDGARAGKYSHLVFSMSSHGTQVPDVDGDEDADHVDEAFCPHDLAVSGNQWDKNHIIVDDELRDLFVQLPEEVLLEVFLDTCHSGTGVRAVDLLIERKPRFLPPPSMEAFEMAENKKSRGVARLMFDKGIIHNILWAACRSDQTSADAKIDNNWHGAFTYYFCKEIRACRNRLSRAKLLTKIRADLKAGKYSQVPQLECEATKRSTVIG